MHRILALFAAVLVVASARAAPPEPVRVPIGTVVEGMRCLGDPTQTYTLYLPSSFDAGRRWPVLLVFDPRGRSVMAAELFRPAAERWGWIVVSSDDTRSDGTMEPNLVALRALWPEVRERYPSDPRRIYAAGFSGGGHVAYLLGRETGGLAGIIASGSRLIPELFGEGDFAFFAAAGTRDFNYAAMRDVDAFVAARGNPHRFVTFEGVHAWMPPDLAAEAVAWMELVAMRQGRREPDDGVIGELWAQELATARRMEHDGDLIAAHRRFDTIVRTFGGLRDVAAARAALSRLAADPAFARALEEERRLLAWETRMSARFATAYAELVRREVPMPPALLRRELGLAGLLKRSAQEDAEGTTARRLLAAASVQLAFYLPMDLLAQHRWGHAATALTVALEINDRQPGAWYNLACAHARGGHVDRALAALRRAVEVGYADAEHARTDPDLAPLRTTDDFQELLAVMGG